MNVSTKKNLFDKRDSGIEVRYIIIVKCLYVPISAQLFVQITLVVEYNINYEAYAVDVLAFKYFMNI